MVWSRASHVGAASRHRRRRTWRRARRWSTRPGARRGRVAAGPRGRSVWSPCSRPDRGASRSCVSSRPRRCSSRCWRSPARAARGHARGHRRASSRRCSRCRRRSRRRRATRSPTATRVRFPLRIPLALFLGPVPLAVAVDRRGRRASARCCSRTSSYVAARPSRSSSASPLAVVLARSLHALLGRWLVLVPAGLVVVDPLTFADPVLMRREQIESCRALPADGTRRPGVVDLRLGSARGHDRDRAATSRSRSPAAAVAATRRLHDADFVLVSTVRRRRVRARARAPAASPSADRTRQRRSRRRARRRRRSSATTWPGATRGCGVANITVVAVERAPRTARRARASARALRRAASRDEREVVELHAVAEELVARPERDRRGRRRRCRRRNAARPRDTGAAALTDREAVDAVVRADVAPVAVDDRARPRARCARRGTRCGRRA